MEPVESWSKEKTGWRRVFCPYTRVLTAEEISAISAEEKVSIEAGDEGVWLEVKCPKDKCLIGEHNIRLEARGVKSTEEEGLWHKLFCPEDSCMVQSSVDLP